MFLKIYILAGRILIFWKSPYRRTRTRIGVSRIGDT